MIQVLLGVWKKKIKIIDDESLFKALSAMSLAVFTIAVAICEIYLMNRNEFIIMILLNAFQIIYNKPTILCSVMQQKNAAFMIKKKTFFRFVLFQILKENALLVAFVVIQAVVFLYSLFSLKFAIILAIWVLAVDIYLLEIYSREKKLLLLLLSVCVFVWTIHYNMWVLLFMTAVNARYLYGTLHREVLDYVFINRRRDVFIGKSEVTIRRVNSLFFLRMPFQEILEFLYEIILVCTVRYFIQTDIAFYLFIAVFLVDIELVQDEKMKNYDNCYGKSLFLNFTKITEMQKFLLSVEFNCVIKYVLLSLPLLIIEITSHTWDLYFGFSYINILILVFAISHRYYCATDCVLKVRKLIEHTWFRMVMLYLVLFDLAPLLFEKVLWKLDGYQPLYGCVFTACITVLVLFVKVENIVKVAGEDVNEKTV
ncbi:hypothetical protein E5329_26965 [Petralouisia muris]|uniref:Uncharacterized protein n=1 Tax=Petralouisia muris TaxID=3032872 RepID=A0AC61RPK5_9FIRM|nr:hypothetical protein [Petralouisia muris]TGY87129.1 hypothetical protein E5329_26965 [Petralouisia muris]